MRQERFAEVPVIDLFAGPGGLGEGFSALRVSDDRQPFKIQLSIEKDATAHETLRLRSFYRQFAPSAVPAKYYDVLREQLSIPSLFEAYPAEAKVAGRESWQATLGLTARRVLNGRIRNALNGSEPAGADWRTTVPSVFCRWPFEEQRRGLRSGDRA